MLFLTDDNSFRGEDTSISLDEVIEATKVHALLNVSVLPVASVYGTLAEALLCRSCTAA